MIRRAKMATQLYFNISNNINVIIIRHDKMAGLTVTNGESNINIHQPRIKNMKCGVDWRQNWEYIVIVLEDSHLPEGNHQTQRACTPVNLNLTMHLHPHLFEEPLFTPHFLIFWQNNG